MNQRHSLLTGFAVAAMLVLGACGSGSDNDGETAETVVDTRITPPTIPAGQIIEPGSIASETQELDSACAEVLQPIRDLEKKYQSGLEMTDADRPAFNKALTEGYATCSTEDWAAFQEKELKGWMNQIPSDEAKAKAEEEALKRAEEQDSAAADTTTEDTSSEATTESTDGE